MNLLFWKKKETPPPLSPEEQRHQKDAAQLAEYNAFDSAVGSGPTKETLTKRFRDAVFAGYTEVVKDSIRKGFEVPNEVGTILYGPGDPLVHKDKILKVAVWREWADMVEVLLPYVDQGNLEEGLRAAESQKNVVITKAIRAEMGSRPVAHSAAVRVQKISRDYTGILT